MGTALIKVFRPLTAISVKRKNSRSVQDRNDIGCVDYLRFSSFLKFLPRRSSGVSRIWQALTKGVVQGVHCSA